MSGFLSYAYIQGKILWKPFQESPIQIKVTNRTRRVDLPIRRAASNDQVNRKQITVVKKETRNKKEEKNEQVEIQVGLDGN